MRLASLSPRHWLLLASGAILALGLTAIAGWVSSSTILVTMLPGGAPMVINTAVGMVLISVGLAGIAFGRPTLTRICGGLLVALGAITFAQFPLERNLGIDELLLRQRILVDVSSPGRMAPNTAVALSLVGVILVLLTAHRLRSRVLVVLAALVIGGSFLAICGYFTGLRTAFSWGRFTGMALPTAIALLLAGVSLMRWITHQALTRAATPLHTLPFFATAGAMFLVVGAVAIVNEMAQQQAAESVEHSHAALDAIHMIELNVTRIESAVRGHVIEPRDTMTEDFASEERRLVAMLTNVKSLLAESPAHLARLGNVERLVGQKLDFMRRVIAPARREAPSAEAEMIRLRDGARLMEEIRVAIDEIARDVRHTLVAEQASNRIEIRQTIGVTIIGGTLTALVFFAALVVTQRAQSARARAEQGLVEANDQLQQRVERRTAQLRASEESFRFLADAVPQFIWTAQPDGTRDYYNQRWVDYTGLSVEQTRTQQWGTVLHPDDYQITVDNWANAIATEGKYEIEHRFKRASDGAYRWHLGRAFPQRDAAGRIVRWVGTCTDIHDQKLAAEILERRVAERTAELMASEDRFRSVSETANDAIVVADERGKILTWNNGARSIFGYAPEEIAGQSLARLLPERLRPTAADWLGTFRPLGDRPATGRPDELVGQRRDGQEFPMEISFTSWTNGGATFYGSVMRDITERRTAENNLRRSQLMFQRLFDSSPDAILAVDASGRIVQANVKADALFGYGPAELAGASINVLLPEHIRARHADHLLRYFAAPRTRAMGAGIELFARRRDATEFPVDIMLSPLESDEGPRALAVVRDITERKQVEERLRASLSEKEVLLREIHHRVKNNLQVIASLLRFQARASGDSNTLAALRDSESRVQTMALLHEQLYRSENFNSIDLERYFRELTGTLAAAYATAAIRIESTAPVIGLDLESAIPLGLIVNELVTNSLKHAFPAGRQGRVRLALQADGPDGYTLTVDDDGIGLPPGFIPESSTSMGIRLVCMLSRQLGGSYTFHSENGAKFELRFSRPTSS